MLAQLLAIIVVILLLWRMQRLLHTPLEGDEEILEDLKRAEHLQEVADSYSTRISNQA